MCIYIYIKTDNVPSRLLQWPPGNPCTWAHNARLHITGTNEPNETSVCMCCDNITKNKKKQGLLDEFSYSFNT